MSASSEPPGGEPPTRPRVRRQNRLNRTGRGRHRPWWSAVLATSVVSILVPSLSLCQGLVAIHVTRRFPETSWVQVAGLAATMLAVWNLMGPATVLLHEYLSSRFLGIMGGLVMAAGLSLNFINADVTIFYVTLGILAGVGAGLVESTSGMMLKFLFFARHDKSSRLCLLIRSLGQMLMPHFIFFLLDYYDLRGGLLIYGGVILHVCAASFLFPSTTNTRERTSQNGQTAEKRQTRRLFVKKAKPSTKKYKKKKRKRRKSTGDVPDTTRWKNPKDGVIGPAGRRRTISIDSSRMLPDIPEELEPISEEDDMDVEEDNEDEVDDDPGLQMNVPCEVQEPHVLPLITARFRTDSTTSSVSFASSTEWEHPHIPKSHSLPSMYSDSSLSMNSSMSSLSEMRNSTTNCSNSNGTDVKVIKKPVTSCGVLRDPVLWLVTVSCTLVTLTNYTALLYLPFVYIKGGGSDHGVACLLSVYVGTNIVGRLFAMSVYGRRLSAQIIFNTMGLLNVIVIAVFIFVHGKTAYFLATAAFALTTGGCSVLMAPLLACFFGQESYKLAVNFLQIAQGVVLLVGNLLIGYSVSETATFTTTFWVMLAAQSFSVVIWGLLPLAERCRKRGSVNTIVTDV